jgi:hypothetical protein
MEHRADPWKGSCGNPRPAVLSAFGPGMEGVSGEKYLAVKGQGPHLLNQYFQRQI